MVVKQTRDGRIRVNMDLTFSENKTCLARIARTREGIIQAWSKLTWRATPTQAEAEAVLLVLQIAVDQSWKNVQLLSDALVVVDSICNPSNAPWEIKPVIMDILCILSTLDNWECLRINREFNKEAHDLEQIGKNSQFDGLILYRECQHISRMPYYVAMPVLVILVNEVFYLFPREKKYVFYLRACQCEYYILFVLVYI